MDKRLVERLLDDLSELRNALATEGAGATSVDVDRAEWLAGILAHSPDVISILDLEGKLLYVSRTVPGADAKAIIGRDSADFLPPEYRPAWRSALSDAVKSKHPQRVEVRSRTGHFWDTRIVPIQRDGAFSWLLCIGTDVSPQKEAQAALALRDEQLRWALEASGMGQWSWDVASDQVTWDAAARRIFVWPEDEQRIAFEDFIDRMHPDDRERMRASMAAGVETGTYQDFSCRIVVPDGSVRWIIAKGRALRDASGKTTRLIGGVLDITHGKRTETQHQRSQKLEAIGQLAGGVAHDFNNLLVAIIGNMTLAGRSEEPGERNQLLLEATAAANRAAELTRQLLAFSTRQPLNQAALDMNAVLSDTLRLLRRLLPESVEIDLIPAHRLPRVLADRGQLEQVVVNLCVNARDAMPNGGKLAIETESVVINGRFRETHPWARPGRYVLVSLTDTGVGIPPEALDHVFEPFYTTKPHGTGLGLASVYGTVQRHGGFVHVYSEVGKGTTFKVYLPVAERDAADVGTKVESPVVGGRETILVAEDEARVRAVVVRILQRAGYEVVTADDGEQAVERFRESPTAIRLVLADAVMPNKSGAEAIAEIRAIAPSVAVVLCSGYTDALGGMGEPGSGVAFLSKPYEPDMLLRIVREQLDAHR